jgi:hypothetical protein
MKSEYAFAVKKTAVFPALRNREMRMCGMCRPIGEFRVDDERGR